MKSLLSNSILILLVRVLLGGLFIVASLDKIVDPYAFTTSILNYKVIDSTFATATATFLPWLELLCGIGLILGLYPRGSLLLITAMLIVFTILVASALFRGFDISCGCFSQDPNASKIGYQKILENCGMIVLGIYLMFAKNLDISFVDVFRRKNKKIDTTSV